MLWLLDDLKFVSKLMQFLIKLLFLLLEALQDVINVKSLSLTVFISLSKWFLYFYLRIHRAIKNLRLSLSSELFIGCLESLDANLWLQERPFWGSKSTTSPIYLLIANYLRLKLWCIVKSVVNGGMHRLEMAWWIKLIFLSIVDFVLIITELKVSTLIGVIIHISLIAERFHCTKFMIIIFDLFHLIILLFNLRPRWLNVILSRSLLICLCLSLYWLL